MAIKLSLQVTRAFCRHVHGKRTSKVFMSFDLHFISFNNDNKYYTVMMKTGSL